MVRIRSLRPGRERLQESTMVEFGATHCAIFMSSLPLEFDERVEIVRTDKGQAVEAAVIALQYHEGLKAVAVRFLEGHCEWMMQP